MPMSVTYATVHGRLVEENRGGVVTEYVPDTLGNVIMTTNESGTVTSTTTYWPFGEVRTQTGTNPSPWGFCGVWGYLRDAISRMYVRARHYRADTSRWLSVDPLWPHELAYEYVNQVPNAGTDSTGRSPVADVLKILIDSLESLLSCGCKVWVYPCLKASGAFGFSKGYDHTNALGHCMASCCIKKTVPYCLPYWNARELGAIWGHWGSCMDDWNNKIGFGCASSNDSCFKCCLANRDKLSWWQPSPHNWPPPGGCNPSAGPPTPPRCGGKICPVGSHLHPSTCECVWH